jgi:hypothetical protein
MIKRQNENSNSVNSHRKKEECGDITYRRSKRDVMIN